MLFSGVPFLYYFFPTVLILYFAVPRKFKNSVLLISSLFFYAWGEPKYVFLMGAAIILGFLFGHLTKASPSRGLRKMFLILSVICAIGALSYFKYADFFITNINAVTGLSLPLLRIALPIGISFYLFQILSYEIDVYKGTVEAQRNIISFGAYVALFPQLIAGPIVRYSDIEKELNGRTHSFENIYYGAKRFILGLSKKVLIANLLGELCQIFKDADEKSVLFYWLYAISFTLHIYFDFSGYSDMAIGLGRIFGFHFPENFNYPYISKSVTEFWRRWHISLGTWFRDYVYIPLGGNRTSKPRWLLNIFIVWMLTGFWHGSAWNFIAWGLLYAFFLIIEKVFFSKVLVKSKALSSFYTLLIVILGCVLFDAATITDALLYLQEMFFLGSSPVVNDLFFYHLRSYAVILIIAIIGCTPLPKILWEGLRSRVQASKFALATEILEVFTLCILLLVVTAFLVDGSYNPFLYFRF